jgi:hypothetical protein
MSATVSQSDEGTEREAREENEEEDEEEGGVPLSVSFAMRSIV